MKLERALGQHAADGVDRRALFSKLTQRVVDTLPLGANLKATEHQHADGFALLACHVALDDHVATGSWHLLTLATYLLEWLTGHSAANPQLKLLLLRCYAVLGYPAAMLVHYSALEIKQIQYDSVAYTFWDHVPRFGQWQNMVHVFTTARDFFHDARGVTAEHQCQAYKHQTYNNVRD